jgi:type IV secretory pathway VirB2 component (pilin)
MKQATMARLAAHESGLTVQRAARKRFGDARAWLVGCMVLAQTQTPAWASLSEAEGTATWVLNIFSPGLLLTMLTLLLIGCGLAVYFGKMSGQMFVKILIGSILIFGARTIAPKIVALF